MGPVPEEEQLYLHTARGCKHPLVTFKNGGGWHECPDCGEYTEQFLPSDPRLRERLGEDVADDLPRVSRRKHTSTPTLPAEEIYEKPVTRQAARNRRRIAKSERATMTMYTKDGWMTARRPHATGYETV